MNKFKFFIVLTLVAITALFLTLDSPVKANEDQIMPGYCYAYAIVECKTGQEKYLSIANLNNFMIYYEDRTGEIPLCICNPGCNPDVRFKLWDNCEQPMGRDKWYWIRGLTVAPCDEVEGVGDTDACLQTPLDWNWICYCQGCEDPCPVIAQTTGEVALANLKRMFEE